MSRPAGSRRWFVGGTSPAPVRLFCLPFAGGGASIYRTWARELPGIDVVAVQLPGREDRYGEPAYTNLRRLTADLATAIEPMLDRPAVFFGHSMGGAIAYQLAVDLKARGLGPRLLILSARHAPHVPLSRPPIHTLSDEAFVGELRKLSGTPTAVLDNRELMDFLLPILRADFELCDTHACAREAAIDVPLLLFGGVDDATAPRHALEAWREYSSGALELKMFPGGHFFLQTHQAAVLQAIRAAVGVRGAGRDGTPGAS